MDKELIINAKKNDVSIALLENKKLVELHEQKKKSNFIVGDIFLGRVKKLVPGLNAAFVDIGHEKDAFLHYTDLGPKLPVLQKFTKDALTKASRSHSLKNIDLNQEIDKKDRIDNVLKKRELILVQILKEPISSKGPRLTCELTIPGRLVVLTPFSNHLSISKKIADREERKRLKVLVDSIRPKNFGVIVRTAAENKKVAELHEDLRELESKWEAIHRDLGGAQEPMKLLSELDKSISILRDFISDDFTRVAVNDSSLYNNINSYLKLNVKKGNDILELYSGKRPIFDANTVTKQIKASFGKTFTMKSGAYLVIEHTEAMHVIDVNSGPKMATNNQDEAIFAVNLESAQEIARQLRLRDIGGLIVVDFIDMKRKEHRAELIKKMREFMKNDRAQHTILPLSKFGLMQITRQRVRPVVKINTSEVCPTCNGTGTVTANILVVDSIERDLEFILQTRPKSKIRILTHPFVYSFLRSNFWHKQREWYKNYHKWIKLSSDNDMPMIEYKFFDSNNQEIRLNQIENN